MTTALLIVAGLFVLVGVVTMINPDWIDDGKKRTRADGGKAIFVGLVIPFVIYTWTALEPTPEELQQRERERRADREDQRREQRAEQSRTEAGRTANRLVIGAPMGSVFSIVGRQETDAWQSGENRIFVYEYSDGSRLQLTMRPRGGGRGLALASKYAQ